MLRRHFTILPVLPALGWLGACVSRPSGQASTHALGAYSKATLLALLPQDAILLGEQHDAAEHQSIHRQATETLAERGLLAALVLEMAEAGRSTQGLAPDTPEVQVKQGLAWNDRAWNWANYGPAIMAAVRVGVVVVGANLARVPMLAAMRDTQHDQRLKASAFERQQQDIREGHCSLLPESQIVPMTRVQIARDVSMAQTVQAQTKTGKTVLLLAGAAHVERVSGIPAHWSTAIRSVSILLRPQGASTRNNGVGFDRIWTTSPVPSKDYCAEFKRSLRPASG